MTRLPFRIVNVFARPGDPFSGNPLCVFEDGSALSDAQMQALARQTNLAETTFLLPPSATAARPPTARVRIFTPTLEMPFAGHPTLGTAHVVRAMGRGGDDVTLEMKAGLVDVRSSGDTWTLETAYPPRTRAVDSSATEIAAMVAAPRLGGVPLWVDTGIEQLVVPLASPEDVAAANPSPELLLRHASRTGGDKLSVYVWARIGDVADGKVVARYVYVQLGGVNEDPATGSACANLGGWLLATGATNPLTLEVSQGTAVARPSTLRLRVDSGRVFVGGLVTEVGSGEMRV